MGIFDFLNKTVILKDGNEEMVIEKDIFGNTKVLYSDGKSIKYFDGDEIEDITSDIYSDDN